MIPDDAVEAAAEAIRDLWDSGEPVTPEMEAKAALEAAGPHLMAAAWERGQADMVHDLFRDQELQKKGGRLGMDDTTPNPYRKPTNV